MRRDRLALAVATMSLTMAVLACNLQPGIPITPTVAPTLVSSSTPSPTVIALLPSSTSTETATQTPTELATETLTETPTATDTPFLSPTATTTLTLTATETHTPNPSITPTDTPTETLSPTPFSTDTPRPTDTLVPTDTPAPTVEPSSTQIPPTAPPIDLGIITLTPTEQRPTLVPLPPVASPVAGGPTPIPVGPPPTVGSGFGLTPDTGPRFTPTAVVLGGVPGGGGISGTLSPTDPRLVRSSDVSVRGNTASIDTNGRLYVDGQPYYVRVPRAEMRFTHVRWSPDGRWLAFVVQVPNAASDQVSQLQKIDDGLWVVELGSGEPRFVMRQWYDNPHDDPKVRVIEDILWAPDSNAILVTVRRHLGRASVLVGIGGALTSNQYPNEVDKFPIMDFLGGAWLADGQGFVATSSLPGESARLAIRYRDGRYVQIADGAALQMWIQNAAQLPDGRFAFLGKPSPTGRLEDSTGRLQLYVLTPGGTPTPVSGEIAGSVLYADWDLARQTVKVRVRVGDNSSSLTLRVP